MKTKYKKVHEIPGSSTPDLYGANLIFPGGDLLLRFDYYRDGVVYRSGLQFLRVRALRVRQEIHSLVENVRIAYDSLVEIAPSAWVDELLADTPQGFKKSWIMNHYLIFIDGSGSFEMVAESWAELPEETGSWGTAIER